MRLVVDTNVFVSAAIKVNSLPFLVVRWIDQHGGLIKSAVIEQEILSVLSRPQIAAVTSLSFRDGLPKMLARAELVTIKERVIACRDPKDDKFLELAVNGHADRSSLAMPISSLSIRSGRSRSLHRPPSCKASRDRSGGGPA